MKNISYLVIIALIFTLFNFSATAATPNNIVLNGDFSDGTNLWLLENTGVAQSTLSNDNGWGKVTIQTQGAYRSNIVLRQIFNYKLLSGVEYQISFKTKCEGIIGATRGMDVYIRNSSKGTLFSKSVSIGTAESSQTYKFTPSQDYENGDIIFRIGDNTGSFSVDDVSVTALNPPTPDDIVLNGDFVYATNPWLLENTGVAQARLSNDNGWGKVTIQTQGAYRSNIVLRQIFSYKLLGGVEYQISFKTKCEGILGATRGMDVYIRNSSKGTLFSKSVSIGTAESGQTYKYTPTQDYENADIIFRIGDNTGSFSVDDVSVTALASQTTPTPSPTFDTNHKLAIKPPELINPITIYVSNTNRSPKNFVENQDYIIVFNSKLNCSNGLDLNFKGARNIVIIGGEIEIPYQGVFEPGSAFGKKRRGLSLVNWKGVCHIEGLWIHGEDLAEGINIDTRYENTTFQVQNLRVDGVKGRPEQVDYAAADWHPDIIQNWGGPTNYYIDYMTGSTDYQAFMFQPIQYGSQYVTNDLNFKHVNIVKTSSQGYAFFRSAGVNGISLTDVWVNTGVPLGYPTNDTAWQSITRGLSPNDFVTAGSGGVNVAGMGYISPGYLD